MLKTYTATATTKIIYNSGNDILNLVSGSYYTLDDQIALKFTNVLLENSTWKTLDTGIAVNLADVVKTYTVVKIKGKKYITLKIKPTGTVPVGLILLATLKNQKGETIDTSTITTVATITTDTTFSFKLNKPFEIYDLVFSLTFPLGTAYSVAIDINDPSDSLLTDFKYKNSDTSWVQLITPTLS